MGIHRHRAGHRREVECLHLGVAMDVDFDLGAGRRVLRSVAQKVSDHHLESVFVDLSVGLDVVFAHLILGRLRRGHHHRLLARIL